MRVTRYEPSDEAGRGRLDTNTVARLDDVGTFAELLRVLAELRDEHSPARILCTLDDVGQCAYTSSHDGGRTTLAPPTSPPPSKIPVSGSAGRPMSRPSSR